LTFVHRRCALSRTCNPSRRAQHQQRYHHHASLFGIPAVRNTHDPDQPVATCFEIHAPTTSILPSYPDHSTPTPGHMSQGDIAAYSIPCHCLLRPPRASNTEYQGSCPRYLLHLSLHSVLQTSAEEALRNRCPHSLIIPRAPAELFCINSPAPRRTDDPRPLPVSADLLQAS
jgi:hypothetical protein